MKEIQKIKSELIPEMENAMIKSNMVKVTSSIIEAIKQLSEAVENLHKANSSSTMKSPVVTDKAVAAEKSPEKQADQVEKKKTTTTKKTT